jgi:quercetin dioxygenase-like cupin family protein
VRRETQPVYRAKGIEVQMLVENAGAYLGKLRFEPGTKVPAHRHPESEELLTILSGAGTMTIDGKVVEVRAGDAVRIPVNALHDFAASATHPVEAIQTYTPRGPEERFRSWPKR